MKNLFPQFYAISEDKQKEIWSKAIFVFDTNVLLNIYRYKLSARTELLDVLEKLKDRIWIPHHVALEFQRNRLAVIAGQLKLLVETRKVISSVQNTLNAGISGLKLRKTNSLISTEAFVNAVQKAVADFEKELIETEGQQQKLNGPDKLREKIESLFENRVGLAPDSQDTLNKIYQEADVRFKKLIPPGYIDNEDKKNESTNDHSHQGLDYKRQYGDYVVWKQILDYAKSDDSKRNIILVTSDAKKDWWLEFDANGPKTIGARPELIDEIKTKAGVEGFLMYNTESFLHHAKSFSNAVVSQDTLEEVSKVTEVADKLEKYAFKDADLEASLLSKVKLWLTMRVGNIFQSDTNPFDFIGAEPDGISSYLVRFGGPSPISLENIMSALIQARDEFSEFGYKEITIIFMIENGYQSREIFETIARSEEIIALRELKIITAAHSRSSKFFGEMDFRIFDEFRYASAINSRKG